MTAQLVEGTRIGEVAGGLGQGFAGKVVETLNFSSICGGGRRCRWRGWRIPGDDATETPLGFQRVSRSAFIVVILGSVPGVACGG